MMAKALQAAGMPPRPPASAEGVASVQAQERERLAQELHDDVGQKLALLKLHLQLMGRGKRASTMSVDDCVMLLDDAIASVRSITSALKPTKFEHGSLLPALRALAQREGQRHGLAVLVDATADLDLPHAIELACYAVVREALANIVKHAAAAHVAIVLSRDGDQLKLLVLDDGRGFDVRLRRRLAAATGHLGLRSIEERIGQFRGVLRVQSTPGTGTTVECVVPLGNPT